MATGWAVGSSVVLAGTLVLTAPDASPLALAPLFVAAACWAFAIARAAYGSKGALGALLAYDLVATALVAVRAALGPGDPVRLVLPGLLALAALATAVAIVGEHRARRGPAQWSTAAALASPLVLYGALALA